MDPNANIEEQLRLASRIVWQQENEGVSSDADAYRLADLVIALNEWIREGGFMPVKWARCGCGHRGCPICNPEECE